ncbi:MAG: hypothetical protein H3C27_01420 [Opitutaceae bacterium]|nr:hypothetical protein [Opitutaceae bacterium]
MKTINLKNTVKAFNAQLKPNDPSGEVAGVLRGERIVDIDAAIAKVCGESWSELTASQRVDAVVDQGTVGCPDDLPVVLAVGINYGQTKTGHSAATCLRPGIAALNGILGRIRGRADPVPQRYHLVAWNLFPFLLRDPWAHYSFNAIEEALIVWRWGYVDWAQKIHDLADSLSACLVLFHGANNEVPYLGFGMVDRLRPSAETEYPRVIFCGNLSRVRSITAGRSAVEIRPPPIMRGHSHEVGDD